MKKIYIPWEKQSDLFWNELCAKVIEHFGLPGNRFTTSAEEQWMSFTFNDEQDYLMCKMLLSEHIVERNSWTTSIDKNGVLTFPQEVIEKTGWKEGDVLDWISNGDGSFSIRKVV